MAVSEGNGREAIKRRLPKAELDHVKPEKTGARAADHIKASGAKGPGIQDPGRLIGQKCPLYLENCILRNKNYSIE